MRARTRVWAVGSAAGWGLLVYGLVADKTWAIAASVLLLFLFAIERADNWVADRRGGGR